MEAAQREQRAEMEKQLTEATQEERQQERDRLEAALAQQMELFQVGIVSRLDTGEEAAGEGQAGGSSCSADEAVPGRDSGS